MKVDSLDSSHLFSGAAVVQKQFSQVDRPHWRGVEPAGEQRVSEQVKTSMGLKSIPYQTKIAVWWRIMWCFIQKPSKAITLTSLLAWGSLNYSGVFKRCSDSFITSSSLFLPLPVVIETMGSRHYPLAGYQRTPTDVGTPDLQAGLPWPLPLCGVGPAHNATGKLPQATIWNTHGKPTILITFIALKLYCNWTTEDNLRWKTALLWKSSILLLTTLFLIRSIRTIGDKITLGIRLL